MHKVTKSYTATVSFIHSSSGSSPWLWKSTASRPIVMGLGQHIMAGVFTHLLAEKQERKMKSQGVRNPINGYSLPNLKTS